MTMYSNNFVVCVMYNGEALHNSPAGVVTLPFGATYQIRLRNKNNVRAAAQVFIDGEEVSDGLLVVGAYSYVDLDCHVGSRRKFKFVSSESSEAIDAGKDNKSDDSNGVIRVDWRLEKVPPEKEVVYVPQPYPVYPPKPWRKYPYPYYDANSSIGLRSSNNGICGQSANSPSYGQHECNFEPAERPLRLSEGCTVEGDRSNQRFTTVSIDLEDAVTTIQLILKGYAEAKLKTQSKQGKCECGQTNPKKAKFCWLCGKPLTKVRKGV
jgi:hypothetical protein